MKTHLLTSTLLCLLLCTLAAAAPFRGIRREKPGDAEASQSPSLELDLGGFTRHVTGLAFSPNGRFLAAAGGDSVRIWDLNTGRLHATLRGYLDRAIDSGASHCLTFSADGEHLAVGALDMSGRGAIRIYKMSNLSEIDAVLPGPRGPVDNLAFSADGRVLAASGFQMVTGQREYILWDWQARRIIRTFTKRLTKNADEREQGAEGRGEEYADPLWYFGFQGGSRELAALGNRLEVFRAPRWDAVDITGASRELISLLLRIYNQEWPQLPYANDDTEPTLARLRLDQGRVLITGLTRQRSATRYWTAVWSVSDSRPQQIYSKHRYGVSGAVFNRDTSLVASSDMLGDVHVWETATGRTKYIFRSIAKAVYNVGFSGDGAELAFGTRPYGSDQWAANHYASLDRTFDLNRRVVLDRATGSYQQPITKVGAFRLRNDLDSESGFVNFKLQRDGQTLTYYPMPYRLYSWSFLERHNTGLAVPVVTGTVAGDLWCFDAAGDGDRKFQMRRSFLGGNGLFTSLSQSADGRLLATGNTDGVMRIYSLVNFQPWADLDFDELSIDEHQVVLEVRGWLRATGIQVGDTMVAFDGTPILEVANRMQQNWKRQGEYRAGQRVTFTVRRRGREIDLPITLPRGYDAVEPLLSLFIAPDGEWILWTPRGYYDASAGGDRLVGWRVNRGLVEEGRYYPVSQFRKTLYRPDVVDAVLQLGDVDRAIEVANAALPRPPESEDFREADVLQKNEPPMVSIISPTDGATVSAAPLSVTVEAKSRNELPVSDVRILINGRPPLAKAVRRESATDDLGHVRVTREITLSPGRNEITAVASNRQASSRAASITVHYRAAQPDRDTVKPKLYVLAVGCSRYKDESLNLKYAHRDAESFARQWQEQEGVFYRDVEVKLLTNDKADTTSVRDGMDWLVQSVTQHDIAMVFLSGHGVRDTRGNYYLATHEIDPQRLRSTGIPYSDVLRLIEDLPGKVIMFVDTCHGGGITGRKALVSDPWRDLVAEEVGAIVFASSHPREESLENDQWQHGAFTKAILDVMGKPESDVNRDGYLSINELDLHISERVKQLTRGQQHPVTQKPPTIRNFNLAKAAQ